MCWISRWRTIATIAGDTLTIADIADLAPGMGTGKQSGFTKAAEFLGTRKAYTHGAALGPQKGGQKRPAGTSGAVW